MRVLLTTFLVLFSFGVFSQKKSEILIYEKASNGFVILVADMDHFIGIPADSSSIMLINSKQQILDHVKLTRGKIKQIVILDKSTITLYAEDKMKVYSFTEDKLKLKKDVKHNTFEVPLQNPLIVETLIIGFTKVKPEQDGMLSYKYAFKDEHSLRDISIPFPIMSILKNSPGVHKPMFFNKEKKEAYIPLPEASRICIFKLTNKRKHFFTFPEHNANSEQWVYYYDHTTQNHFAVLHKENAPNKLYEIKENFSSIEFIKDIDSLPLAIIGEYMHIKRTKSGSGNMQHLLVPIFTHDESKTVIEEYD